MDVDCSTDEGEQLSELYILFACFTVLCFNLDLVREFHNRLFFICLHETEAETASDHITINFKYQDSSSLQTVV